MIELSLQDTDSPVAMQVSELIERDKQNKAQGAGQEQQLQMQKIQLEMQTMSAKLEEIMSKANLNKAKTMEIMPTGEPTQHSQGNA
jgi:hypothetical protein